MEWVFPAAAATSIPRCSSPTRRRRHIQESRRGGEGSWCARWAARWHEAPAVRMVPARSRHRRACRHALIRDHGTASHLNGRASRVVAQQRGAEAAAAGTAGEACRGLGVGRMPQWGSQICCWCSWGGRRNAARTSRRQSIQESRRGVVSWCAHWAGGWHARASFLRGILLRFVAIYLSSVGSFSFKSWTED
jgi:hypothetical protein